MLYWKILVLKSKKPPCYFQIPCLDDDSNIWIIVH